MGLIWGLLARCRLLEGDDIKDMWKCLACMKPLTKKTLYITECGCQFHKECWAEQSGKCWKPEESYQPSWEECSTKCYGCRWKEDNNPFLWNDGNTQPNEIACYMDIDIALVRAFYKEGSFTEEDKDMLDTEDGNKNLVLGGLNYDQWSKYKDEEEAPANACAKMIAENEAEDVERWEDYKKKEKEEEEEEEVISPSTGFPVSESNKTNGLKGLVWGLLTAECFEDEHDCRACGESLTKKTIHITECGCLYHKACWEGHEKKCGLCPYKYEIYKWDDGEIHSGEEQNYGDKLMEAMKKEGSIPKEDSDDEEDEE
jgi:hypothetical protein